MKLVWNMKEKEHRSWKGKNMLANSCYSMLFLLSNPHQINPSSLYLYIPRLGLSKKCYQCIRVDCDCSAAPDFRKEAGNLKLSIYLLKVTTTSNTSKSRFCNKSSRNKGSSIYRVRWQLVKCTDVGRLVCHARLLGHFVWIRNVVTKWLEAMATAGFQLLNFLL